MKTIVLFGNQCSGISTFMVALYSELKNSKLYKSKLQDIETSSTCQYFEFLEHNLIDGGLYPPPTEFGKVFNHHFKLKFKDKTKRESIYEFEIIEMGSSMRGFPKQDVKTSMCEYLKTKLKNQIRKIKTKQDYSYQDQLKMINRLIEDKADILLFVNPHQYEWNLLDFKYLNFLSYLNEVSTNKVTINNLNKVGVILTISDSIPEHLNDPAFYIKKYIPKTMKYADENFKEIQSFAISAIGQPPGIVCVDDKWIQCSPVCLVPINVLEPIKFLLDKDLDLII